jgi:chemotaxis protein histidine kinase CheA
MAEELLSALQKEQSKTKVTNAEIGAKVDAVQKQLVDAKDALQRATALEKNQQKELDNLNAKLTTATQKNQDLTNALQSKSEELEKAKNALSYLQSELSNALETAKALEAKLDAASAEVSQLKKDYKAAAKENAQLQATTQQQTQSLAKLQAEKEALNQELAEWKSKHSGLVAELALERQNGQFSKLMINKLTMDLETAQHLNQQLMRQLASIHAHLQNSFVHDYPSAYLFTRKPKDGSGMQQQHFKRGIGSKIFKAAKGLGKAIETVFVEEYYCYILCEFQCSRGQFPELYAPQWHQVIWKEQSKHEFFRKTIKEASKFAKDLVGLIRTTCLVLKIAAVLGRVSGVPVPDLTELIPDEIMDIVLHTNESPAAVLASSFIDEEDAKILEALRTGSIQPESVRPVALHGAQLDLVKHKFDNQKVWQSA